VLLGVFAADREARIATPDTARTGRRCSSRITKLHSFVRLKI
jgi:hypothetical protein